jgi:hypothetical protein
MKIPKRLLRPERQRQIPPHFSWIDHRLIRHHYLRACDPPAWALYLVTVTVADAQGLSYYSDASLCRMLRLEPEQLARARQQLLTADVLAYDPPLYQVLALAEPQAPATPERRLAQPLSAGQILHRILSPGGAA